MLQFRQFIKTHPDFFRHQKSVVVHPHDELLAKTILRFIPNYITPNQLTLFRIMATPFVFFLTLYNFYTLGIVTFVLVAFTDAMDGSMARTRGQITEFGKIFDPLADKFLIGSMVLILVFSNFPAWLGFTILALEIILIVAATIFTTKFHTVRAANRWGKTKMMLQVIAVGITMMALLFQFPYLLTIAAWVFGISIGCAVISLFKKGI